jgi:hypothetical protein
MDLTKPDEDVPLRQKAALYHPVIKGSHCQTLEHGVNSPPVNSL